MLKYKYRFWRKVNKQPTINGCLLWFGATSRSGYGVFRVESKNVFAHRWIYENQHGKIPDGLFVCHTCDVRSCVNINHLYIGTNQQNATDMVNKGRQAYGSINGQAQLSEIDVSEIRTRYKLGQVTQQILADEFGVSSSQISRIIRRDLWKSVL